MCSLLWEMGGQCPPGHGGGELKPSRGLVSAHTPTLLGVGHCPHTGATQGTRSGPRLPARDLSQGHLRSAWARRGDCGVEGRVPGSQDRGHK